MLRIDCWVSVLKKLSSLNKSRSSGSIYVQQFEAQQQQKVTLLCQEIQALLHTLPREHITMKQLQEALVDVNPANLRKLMSQMCRDGYVENTPKVRWKGMNSDSEHPMSSFSYFLSMVFSQREGFPFMFSSSSVGITPQPGVDDIFLGLVPSLSGRSPGFS